MSQPDKVFRTIIRSTGNNAIPTKITKNDRWLNSHNPLPINIVVKDSDYEFISIPIRYQLNGFTLLQSIQLCSVKVSCKKKLQLLRLYSSIILKSSKAFVSWSRTKLFMIF